MLAKHPFALSMVALALIAPSAAPARAEDAPHSAGQNVAEMKFVEFPGLPPCTTGAVLNGDPGKGSSIILAKVKSGCVIPWHWHTPNEHLMLVSGSARAEMKDGPSITLKAGGFALMPTKHVHRFTCTSSCLMYIYSDAAFDIHYVDAGGQEIPPDEALKAKAPAAAKKKK